MYTPVVRKGMGPLHYRSLIKSLHRKVVKIFIPTLGGCEPQETIYIEYGYFYNLEKPMKNSGPTTSHTIVISRYIYSSRVLKKTSLRRYPKTHENNKTSNHTRLQCTFVIMLHHIMLHHSVTSQHLTFREAAEHFWERTGME